MFRLRKARRYMKGADRNGRPGCCALNGKDNAQENCGGSPPSSWVLTASGTCCLSVRCSSNDVELTCGTPQKLRTQRTQSPPPESLAALRCAATAREEREERGVHVPTCSVVHAVDMLPLSLPRSLAPVYYHSYAKGEYSNISGLL